MNKKLLYSLIASLTMISAGAYANEPVQDDDNSALTTKGYVDAGLKFVYDSAKSNVEGIETDITNLQEAVGTAGTPGNAGTGLVGDVEELQNAIGTAGQNNEQGTGLTGRVEALEDAVTTLDNLGTNNLGNNKKYILQTNSDGEGSWSEIKVESTWNPTAFTNNVVNGGN
jgi:hypothetical protein